MKIITIDFIAINMTIRLDKKHNGSL